MASGASSQTSSSGSQVESGGGDDYNSGSDDHARLIINKTEAAVKLAPPLIMTVASFDMHVSKQSKVLNLTPPTSRAPLPLCHGLEVAPLTLGVRATPATPPGEIFSNFHFPR